MGKATIDLPIRNFLEDEYKIRDRSFPKGSALAGRAWHLLQVEWPQSDDHGLETVGDHAAAPLLPF